MANLDVRIGTWFGYPRLMDFCAELRPGWWTMRGIYLGLIPWALILGPDETSYGDFIDWPLTVLLIVTIAASVVVSVRIGRAGPVRRSSVSKAISVAVQLVLAWIVLRLFVASLRLTYPDMVFFAFF